MKNLPITLETVRWTEHYQELYSIRYQVFVQEQNVPEELEQDEFDPLSQHILARTAEGQAIGTGRLLPDGHIGRIAVLSEWRGHGIGHLLMKQLIELGRNQNFKQLGLNAQISALGFYRQLGFVPSGEPFLEAGIMHQSMTLTFEDE